MTLAAQAEALVQEALDIDQIRRDAAAAQRRSEVITELLQLRQDIQAPADFLRRCRDRGIAPRALGRRLAASVRTAQQHLQRLDSDVSSGLGLDETLLVEARRSLVGLSQRLKDLAESAWSSYCETHVPRGQGSALVILKAVLGPAPQVIELERLDSLLDAYRTDPPLDRPQDVDIFLTKLERRRELWARLDVGDLPRDVQRFLMEVPAGAPLPLLTPQVRKWLSANDLLGRYRVVADDA